MVVVADGGARGGGSTGEDGGGGGKNLGKEEVAGGSEAAAKEGNDRRETRSSSLHPVLPKPRDESTHMHTCQRDVASTASVGKRKVQEASDSISGEVGNDLMICDEPERAHGDEQMCADEGGAVSSSSHARAASAEEKRMQACHEQLRDSSVILCR